MQRKGFYHLIGGYFRVDTSDRRKFSLVVINVLFLSIASVFLTHDLIISLFGQVRYDSVTNRCLLLFLGSILNILLINRSIKVSAALTTIIPVIILYLFPFFFMEKQGINEGIIINMMGVFMCTTIPFVVYSIRKDFKTILSFNLIIILIHFLTQYYLVHLERNMNRELAVYFKGDYVLLILFQLSIWQFLFWLLTITYTKSERYEVVLRKRNQLQQKQNGLIIEQKKQIEIQYTELKEQREQLSLINDKLELLVQERTQTLNQQNSKLVEYAYINSHLLRGPLCRVKGLKYLIEIDSNNLDEYLLHLNTSVNELDEVVVAIAGILNEEDVVRLREIQDRVRRLYFQKHENDHPLF